MHDISCVHQRLSKAKIILPAAPAPAANYVPFTRSGSVVYISGQVALVGAEGIRGRVGVTLNLAEASEAARLCGLNLLAQMQSACGGNLNRVRRVLKLQGFVQTSADFEHVPAVMNGCSDLMVLAFGEAGRHARSTVGVFCLPGGFAVEVDAVIEISDGD